MMATPSARRAAQPVEQQLDLPAGDHGGRLVEDQQLGLVDQRLGDLDHLLVGDRQVPKPAICGSMSTPSLRSRSRCVAGACAYGRQGRSGCAARGREDVLGHRQMRKQHEFLIDDVDAGALGVGGRSPTERACLRSRSRRHRAGSTPAMILMSGRLAGAVLADERMDLARPHVEIDARRAPARRESSS